MSFAADLTPFKNVLPVVAQAELLGLDDSTANDVPHSPELRLTGQACDGRITMRLVLVLSKNKETDSRTEVRVLIDNRLLESEEETPEPLILTELAQQG
jgi:hypothetical protein